MSNEYFAAASLAAASASPAVAASAVTFVSRTGGDTGASRRTKRRRSGPFGSSVGDKRHT